MSDTLIVFAKPPIAGRVKTRLHSLLSAEEAASLYRAFLIDSMSQFSGIGKKVVLYFSDGRMPELAQIDLPEVTVRHQRGSELADRLRSAFLDAFSGGAERAVVIGTDHPSLPTEFIARAFEVMPGNHDVVIGPSEDGGYYLLGMSEFIPVLFEEMTFSHERVFDDTVDRAATTRADITILPMWYDVDTPDILPRLYRDLAERPEHAPETLGLLKELALRFQWT